MPRVLTAQALVNLQVVTRVLVGLLLMLLGLSAIVARQFPGRGLEPISGLPAVIAGGLVILMGVIYLLPRRKIESDGTSDGA